MIYIFEGEYTTSLYEKSTNSTNGGQKSAKYFKFMYLLMKCINFRGDPRWDASLVGEQGGDQPPLRLFQRHTRWPNHHQADANDL